MQRIEAIERVLDLASKQDDVGLVLECLETLRDLAADRIRHNQARGHTETRNEDHEAIDIFEDVVQKFIK